MASEGLQLLAGTVADADSRSSSRIAARVAREQAIIVHCALQRCRMKRQPDTPTFVCAQEGCLKKIHHECFKWLCDNRSTMEVDEENPHHHFCSAGCYTKFHKPAPKPRAAQLRWNNDGANGSDVSSDSIVIDWLTTQGNYEMWRGDSFGRTKISIAGEIAALINAAGVIKERDAAAVMDRITKTEGSFRKAYEWTQNTGAGITCERSIREYVTKLCPAYYELFPILKDNPSTAPLFTNHDSDDDVDDSDDDDSVSVAGRGVTAPGAASIATADLDEEDTDTVLTDALSPLKLSGNSAGRKLDSHDMTPKRHAKKKQRVGSGMYYWI